MNGGKVPTPLIPGAAVQTVLRLPLKPPAAPRLPARPDAGGTLGMPADFITNHVEVSGFTPTAFIYNVEIESDRATAGPAIAEMQELAGKGKGGGGKGGASAKRRGDTALEQGDLTAVLFPDTIRELVSLAAPRLGVRNFVHDGRKLVFTPTLVPLQGGGPGSTDTRASVVVQPTSGPRGSSYRVSLTLTSAQPRDLRPLLSRAGLLAHAQQQRARAGGVGDATTFMEELQVLEVAMRSFFLEGLKWAQIGRQVFPEPRTALRLDLGMELWVGVSQALRPCARGMLLCVDSTGSAVLRAGPVMDLVATQCGGQVPAQLGPADVRRIEGAIKRVKVQLTHLQWKPIKVVSGLAREPASKETFEWTDCPTGARSITVAAYYKQKYNVTLRYPNLPCATFGTTRKTSVPLELLHIVEAQRVPRERMGVANEDSMIKAIAVDPQTRRDRIQAAVDKLAAAPEKVFGMRFNRELLQVPGRILPLPTVMYANGLYAPTNPKDGPSMLNGGWNMIGRQLMEAKPLRNWIFLNTTRNPSRSDVKILAFLGELMNQLKVLGLQSDQPIVEDLGNAPIQQKLLQLCENVRNHTKSKPGAVLVLLSDRDPRKDELYGLTKNFGNVTYGVVTQCFIDFKAFKGLPEEPRKASQYTANLILKINAKLGGVNARLQSKEPVIERPPAGGGAATWGPGHVDALGSFANRPFVVIGADVTHPAPGSDAASLAAVVTSLNRSATKFCANVSVLGPREEMITGLGPAVQSGLNAFRRSTGLQPERILYLRDGVSEGQFSQVLDVEVPLLRQACPGAHITVVSVQKRHNTRLFGKMTGPGGKVVNTCPGVVVDKEIVAADGSFDFFLSSHAAIQGTAKAPKFSVLLDEIGFGSDQLQLMLYWSSWTMQRCTRATSLPPAVYYAHLSADIAKKSTAGAAGNLDALKREIQQLNEVWANGGMMFL